MDTGLRVKDPCTVGGRLKVMRLSRPSPEVPGWLSSPGECADVGASNLRGRVRPTCVHWLADGLPATHRIVA